MAETIKVVIRFKGREVLEDNEKDDWDIYEDKKTVQAPCYEGSKSKPQDLKFTYDHILDHDTT